MTTERKRLRAAVYGRESKGKTKSIADQLKLGRADVAEQGWTLAGVFKDKVSASRSARKIREGWPELLEEIRAGRVDVVTVWETTRADRQLTTWVAMLDQCRALGVLIRVVSDERTYDPRKARDRKDLATAGVDAEYETDRLGERVRRGHAEAAEAGRPNGTVPYGFTRTYEPETRDPIQSAHPDEAPVVREIIARIAAGEPTKVVADDLNRRGVPTRYGGPWIIATVSRIARNPAYVGLRRHNGGKTYDAVWDSIVDEAQFWAAQRVFEARRGQGWRSGRAQHLLSGIGRCAVCGEGYRGSFATRTGKRRYGCRFGHGYVQGEEYEDLILGYVLGRLALPDIYGKLRRADEQSDQAVSAARAEAERLRARLEEARRSAASPDGISYAALAVQERELGRLIAEAEARAERAGLPPGVRELVGAGDDLPARWAAMPLAARRDVVRDLVTVTVRPVGQGNRVPVADRVDIEWKGAA